MSDIVTENVEKDLDLAIQVTKKGKNSPNKLSFSSADRIELISKMIDLDGTKVLSLLDSSDPVFCFYLNGAKSVDTYDENKLAFYYFFLRIWTFNYLNQMYPPRSLNYDFLLDIINNVKPNNENEFKAYNFWVNFIKEEKNDKKIGKLLFKKRNKLIDYSQYDLGLIPFNINSTKFFEVNIRNINIKDNYYDIIYVSDQCDWIDFKNDDDPNIINNLKKYRDNLFRLLSDNGIVLCSTNSCPERMIFQEKFNYIELSKAKDKGGNLVDCGYCYMKK